MPSCVKALNKQQRKITSPSPRFVCNSATHYLSKNSSKCGEAQWLVKIKTDTDGNIHYEPWRQPHDERTAHTPGSRTVNRSALQCPLGIKRPGLRRLGCPTSSPLCLLLPQVLTKPKMLSVKVEWLRVEERVGAPTRYVISAAAYQRLLEAVR